MVQLGFYFHMKQALGAAQYTLTRPLAFAVGFMLFVSIVIALFKDIPDIQGDRQVPNCCAAAICHENSASGFSSSLTWAMSPACVSCNSCRRSDD